MSLNKVSRSGLITIVSTFMVIILAFFLTAVLPFNSLQRLLMFFILITFYLIMLILLYRSIIRRIILSKKKLGAVNPLFQHIQTAIDDEKTPVYEDPKDLVTDSTKVTSKLKYVGSIETKKYHKSNCRFSKLIKAKYRLESNEESFFKKKKFKPCKTCIKKK